MASSHNNSSKIYEQCKVAPPPSGLLPLTFFDLFGFHMPPIEYLFFFTLPSPPSFFFGNVVPKLKTSLSHTLQHFPPLAGNIVWPSCSEKPFVQYKPGIDNVSLVIAESHVDFNTMLDNSPREASHSRSFVPYLESDDSHASIISIQITLFPNIGFVIGITSHHSVLDGKSTIMFIKAWASLCQISSDEESSPPPSLVHELEPFFDREVIKDKNDVGASLVKSITRSLKVQPFQPKWEDSVRATFELTRGDLDKLKKRVLSKWDKVVENGEEELTMIPSSKPTNLSTFVVTCAHVLVCMAKAIQGVENERQKFGFPIMVDCRNRLEPPIHENYFGNCVWCHFVDAQPSDFIKEDGVVLVAKSIHDKIRMLDKRTVKAAELGSARYEFLLREGVEILTVTGSNKFGEYGIDFGWGRPAKVEITTVDNNLGFAMIGNKDGKGGVECGLVLNKHVMDRFITLFHGGLCDD